MTETPPETPAPFTPLSWKKTTEALPEKPGKKSYEYVWCLVIVQGEHKVLPWNCEHLCWDDEHCDDFKYSPTQVDWWVALKDLPTPPDVTVRL